MEEYAVVGMEDKLDLLMVAFNKINMNFYYKFELLWSHLTHHEHGILSMLASVEK